MRPNSVICAAALILSFGAGYLTARRNVLFPPVVGREVPVAIEAGKNSSSSTSQTAALPDARASLAGLSYDQIKQRTVLALREPDRMLRTKAWLEILAGMTTENGKAIADGLMERFRAGGDTKEAGQQLQFREGQVYGLDAITKLPSEPNGKVDWVTQNSIKGWASVDPLATKAWIDSLEPGQAQTSMRSYWLEGLSQSTPAVIASVFDDLPGSDQRVLLGGLMNGIFDQNGIQGMRDWFDSHQSKLDDSVTSSAFVSITSRMAQIDGKSEEAAAFLRSNASSPFFTPKAFEAFADRTATTAPGICLDILRDLTKASPDMQVQLDRLIERTVDLSSATSLNSLGSWLNQHPDHGLYDLTVVHFARRTYQDDPESALRWVGTIKDDALRNRLKQSFATP